MSYYIFFFKRIFYLYDSVEDMNTHEKLHF